jgi:hypothetical protein
VGTPRNRNTHTINSKPTDFCPSLTRFSYGPLIESKPDAHTAAAWDIQLHACLVVFDIDQRNPYCIEYMADSQLFITKGREYFVVALTDGHPCRRV